MHDGCCQPGEPGGRIASVVGALVVLFVDMNVAARLSNRCDRSGTRS